MTEEKQEEQQPDIPQEEAEDAQVVEDYKSKYLYLLADQENFKKRWMKESEERSDRILGQWMLQILQPLDQFEMALSFTEQQSAEVQNWARGFTMILEQWKEIFRQHHIEPFDAKDGLFDPARHDAVERVETDEHVEGTILKQYARGYLWRGRVLRPARVTVAVPPAEQEENLQQKEEEHESKE